MPDYRTAFDDDAGRAVEAMLPGQRVDTVDALPILWGGGASHCISR